MWLADRAAVAGAAAAQGVDGGDVDLPTVLESRFITGFFSKLFFTFVYLGIYAIRPLVVRPKAASEAPPRAGPACWLLGLLLRAWPVGWGLCRDTHPCSNARP